MTLPSDAQWFDELGPCVGCGGQSTGVIRGGRNDNRGPACKRCAERAIKAVHKLGKMLPDFHYERGDAP